MTTFNYKQVRRQFEAVLDDEVQSLLTPIDLLKPMLYSLKGGGKRLRPMLLLTTLALLDEKKIEKGFKTATALEYIHTYSLIHDDLPAMDDDDERRGQPTSHIKFDEATAILTGDALLTDAFGIIVRDNQLEDDQKVELVESLSEAAGSIGMVAGQLADMAAETKAVTLDQLYKVHFQKTGRLFIYAVEAAGIIARVNKEVKAQLISFAKHFGQAYQIHNDLIDIVGEKIQSGRDYSSDIENNKSTYPSLLGLEGALESLNSEKDKAILSLKELEKLTGRDMTPMNKFLSYLQIIIEKEGE